MATTVLPLTAESFCYVSQGAPPLQRGMGGGLKFPGHPSVTQPEALFAWGDISALNHGRKVNGQSTGLGLPAHSFRSLSGHSVALGSG